MLRIEIPQREPIELQHAVFDVNGTLAVDGVTTPEIVDRVRRLSEHLTIHILTAGTHGKLSELEHAFGFPLSA
jgi:soluble P-type ATPase